MAVCDVNPDKNASFSRTRSTDWLLWRLPRSHLQSWLFKAVAISIAADPARYMVANAALNNGIHVIVEACGIRYREQRHQRECGGTRPSLSRWCLFPTAARRWTLPEDVQTEMEDFLTNIMWIRPPTDWFD